MKRTLLSLTQNILAALNSDEVNSIGDTVESEQVAEIIRTTYFNVLGRLDLPEHNQMFQLTPSTDSTQPVVMHRPDGITRIDWIKYNNLHTDGRITLDDVCILSVKDFVDMVSKFNPTETNVDSLSISFVNAGSEESADFTFLYKDDKVPQYCTILQNYVIIFDSFDSAVDSTLQASKTQCYGWIIPAFEMEDDFIPNLDEQQVPLLLSEAKSLAFLELKQMSHPKAEQESKRQLNNVQRIKAVANKPSYFDQLPYFGRK